MSASFFCFICVCRSWCTWEKNSYHQIPPTTPVAANKAEGVDNDSAHAPLELVTVPALGPEWERTEMKQMTKSGRREIKNDDRRAKWRAWNRGEIGLCGTKWFTKKFLVWFIFAWCAVSVPISSRSLAGSVLMLLLQCLTLTVSPSYLLSPSLAYQESHSTAIHH